MSLRAGFAEADITPPIGTLKIGWIVRTPSDRVIDPLYARAVALQAGGEAIGLVSLDTLCVRWTQVAEMRRRIEARYGFPGANLLVAATHNHAGPAVKKFDGTPRDEAYVETMISKVVEMFGRALAGAEDAEIAFGSGFEFGLAHNRRVVMRDGTVRTHGSFDDPDALFLEGPIDPEVAVMALRAKSGRPLGVVVNFACHPTHHGPGGEFSAGYPGVLAAQMKKRGWPAALFLNGACGNVHFADPARGGAGPSMEEIGGALASDAERILQGVAYESAVTLGGRARTVQLPCRAATDAEVQGAVRGAQRFVDTSAYDRAMPALLDRIRRRRTQPAEVQVLKVNRHAFASLPAEAFVQIGLRIKEEARPMRALVVSCANGMVGYVPHPEAFRRGGYETTFGPVSWLAPEAGGMLADAALELLR